jgi:hypothetical protein
MSSTSNVQDLLVNVFRPTYRYQTGTGFVPSLVISNVSEIIATKIKTSTLVVSDSNVNVYIGSNAGNLASNTASNVAIGYSAMGGALNSSNNVAVGTFALDGATSALSNVVIGDGAKLTAAGASNVLIGPSVRLAGGSNNIIIGQDLSLAAQTSQLRIGSLFFGDLSTNRIGLLTSVPAVDVDISGLTRFQNKVGIQTSLPVYSLDVNGSIYTNTSYLVDSKTQASPAYAFVSDPSTGLHLDKPSTLVFDTSGVQQMCISGTNVGIGVKAPAYQLELSTDDAAKLTTNTWTTTSDRRVKRDIERADTSLCYDILKRLPLHRFTWDVSYLPSVRDRRMVGWIAQDVAEVFPSAVKRVSNSWFSDFHSLDVDQLYKTMYGALEKVIVDKERLELQLQDVLQRLATLEASQQSSGLTLPTLPTPPPPEEPPVSEPEPQPQPSSEYAPAPEATEA